MASALVLLGIEHAWVVHGADGLDEVTITGETFVAACSARTGVKTFTISPEDFGLNRQAIDGIAAKGPTENAQLIRAILAGEENGSLAAARDLVIINAAAALHVAGVAHGSSPGSQPRTRKHRQRTRRRRSWTRSFEKQIGAR